MVFSQKEFKVTQIIKTNEVKYVKINLASPLKIISWCERYIYKFSEITKNPPNTKQLTYYKKKYTLGTITNNETVHYETFSWKFNVGIPLGLFCQGTFGPQKRGSCLCGRFRFNRRRKSNFKDLGCICPTCLVEITDPFVRRHRMGFIKLVLPGAHSWYYKGKTRVLTHLLDLKSKPLTPILFCKSPFPTGGIESVQKSMGQNIHKKNTFRRIQQRRVTDPEFSHVPDSALQPVLKAIEKIKRIHTVSKARPLKLLTDTQIIQTAEKAINNDAKLEHVTLLEMRQVLKLGSLANITHLKPREIHRLWGVWVEELNLKYPLNTKKRPTNKGWNKLRTRFEQTSARVIEKKLYRIDTYKNYFGTVSALRDFEILLSDKAKYTKLGLKAKDVRKLINAEKKKLKVLKKFLASSNEPGWLTFRALPILPPGLRPLFTINDKKEENILILFSELNTFYKRLIGRNQSVISLISNYFPISILFSVMSDIQMIIDRLFHNDKAFQPIKNDRQQLLKSLGCVLIGKEGRFRKNLLGKRVNYSGRSVIASGTELSSGECGLPIDMVLELFKPIVIHHLLEISIVISLWQALSFFLKPNLNSNKTNFIKHILTGEPVILNRAPTLHRLGIQAFLALAAKTRAIRLASVCCAGYNADFDGDQMAVHVPLLINCQMETVIVLLGEYNFLSPASGNTIAGPSQDAVAGIFYATMDHLQILSLNSKLKFFSNLEDIRLTYQHKMISLHDPIFILKNNKNHLDSNNYQIPIQDHFLIKYKFKITYILTTLGRVFFNPQYLSKDNNPVLWSYRLMATAFHDF